MMVFNDALFMDAIQSTATAVERTASKRWAPVHLCGEGDQPGHAATDDAFDDDEYEPAGPSSSGAIIATILLITVTILLKPFSPLRPGTGDQPR